MADDPLDSPMEDVTIEVLPHTSDVIKEYCTDQTLDTNVDLNSLPTSMGEMATTLTRRSGLTWGPRC